MEPRDSVDLVDRVGRREGHHKQESDRAPELGRRLVPFPLALTKADEAVLHANRFGDEVGDDRDDHDNAIDAVYKNGGRSQ